MCSMLEACGMTPKAAMRDLLLDSAGEAKFSPMGREVISTLNRIVSSHHPNPAVLLFLCVSLFFLRESHLTTHTLYDPISTSHGE